MRNAPANATAVGPGREPVLSAGAVDQIGVCRGEQAETGRAWAVSLAAPGGRLVR